MGSPGVKDQPYITSNNQGELITAHLSFLAKASSLKPSTSKATVLEGTAWMLAEP